MVKQKYFTIRIPTFFIKLIIGLYILLSSVWLIVFYDLNMSVVPSNTRVFVSLIQWVLIFIVMIYSIVKD